jgi:hypothetical protein
MWPAAPRVVRSALERLTFTSLASRTVGGELLLATLAGVHSISRHCIQRYRSPEF